MAKLYSNENVAYAIVLELRGLGHDVVTSFEAGNANRAVPDAQVLAFAAQQGRVLITNNRRDFLRLHRGGAEHCAIVVFTLDLDSRTLAARISDAVNATPARANFLARVNQHGYSFG